MLRRVPFLLTFISAASLSFLAQAQTTPAQTKPEAPAQSTPAQTTPGAPGQTNAQTPAAPTPDAAGAAEEAPSASTMQARDAFRLGSTLARQGQWRDALAAFERSAELHPHAVTTYNIGYVERALGHLTRARKFLKLSLEQGQTGQTLPEELATLARGYLVEIEGKLARVVVLVESPEMSLTIDGRPLEVLPVAEGRRPMLVAGTLPASPAQRAPATTFDLLIDPGTHVILVSVPGRTDTVLTRVFEQGSSETLRVPEIAESKPPPSAQKARLETPPEQDTSEQSSLEPWMWTAFGVGAAGIITGTVFGILALNEQSTLDEKCDTADDCPPGSNGDIENLDLYAPLADIAFAVGALGIGTGAVLWYLDQDSSSEEGTTVRVQGGPLSAQVSLTGRF